MQLLEHFKELTLHPKNSDQLKGLILQLAVQGKLTKQWRADNHIRLNSIELLEVILKGKKKVLKESSVKNEKPINNFDPSEVKFDLPEKWVWVRFACAAYICRGGSPRPIKSYITEDADGINWIKIGDTKGILKYIEECEEKIIPEGMKMSRLVKPGDFILSNSMSFGRPYIMKTTGCIHDGWLLIREVEEAIDKDFLYHMLSSPYVYGSFKDSAAGGVVQNLNIEKVRQTLIPVPPLEEQKAIVSIVNQLFKEVEELEQQTKARIQLKEDFVTSALQQLATSDTATAWAFLQSHFQTFFTEKSAVKKLRKSILQLAVQGKLTRAFRESHPELVSGSHSAKALLKKIKAEKVQLIKEKKIKAEKLLPEITEDEIPYELPDGWEWCRFQDVIMNIEAGKSPSCYPEKAEKDEWGVIKMSAISWGEFNPEENKALPHGADIFEDKEIKGGDFILTRANTSDLIAKSVIVPKNVRSRLLLNDKTLRFRFFDSIEIQYLNLYNNGSQARDHYREVSSGTSDSMQNISRDNIKLLKLPFPPFEEQKAIVAKVNALMSLCDGLEKEIEQNTQQLKGMMQSCLREVFKN